MMIKYKKLKTILFIQLVILFNCFINTSFSNDTIKHVDVVFNIVLVYEDKVRAGEMVTILSDINYVRSELLKDFQVLLILPPGVELIKSDLPYVGILHKNESKSFVSDLKFSSKGEYKLQYFVRGKSARGSVSESRYVKIIVTE